MSKLSKFVSSYPQVWSLLRWLVEFGFRGEAQVIADNMATLNSDAVILDVGCGTGQLSRHFKRYRYLGVDIDRRFAQTAMNWHHMAYAVMDARFLGIRTNSVDLVLISGLLHHMDDRDVRRVLQEIGRVLRTNGISIIMEDKPVSPFRDPAAWLIHRWDAGSHYRTAQEYRALLPPSLPCLVATTMRSGLCPYVVLILKKVGGNP